MKIDGECLIEWIRSRAENPSLSRLCYRRLWGSQNRRALILGWAYYLAAFSSYPLRTWLPSVYRGHDNWYTRAPGGEEPTSRCQTFPSMWSLGEDQPVIPRVQVVRIFTDMSISPSLSPRQCPDRYAFRAGRNLPDKEFRYLWTVIVTAAVHRGFGRQLRCHQFTNFLNLPALGRRQPPYMVLRLCGDLCFWYPFVESRSSFSWEYDMSYFSVVAPVFIVCLDLVPLAQPAPKQCFTPRYPVNCCASTHFGENQLALGSSGISPLTTTHPLILQHQSVRTST
ncbi:hypothetical protein LUZ61_021084 [Rhynchospora tenuis]|uniref:Uncharacterized protein n=1 Tax=Rhynchospora tenuis TaxID=198213 RepID=A0AAD5W6N2_9POAL|nr:hypothetical protein LUZ61_023215 [Rhynchospora tenuis]KAJ3667528.1 hypothetical protein LUZ61_023117 [Rhynchospora tenuis]KAJ3667533.1 hypothetical protein LUZ61_023115 [Rhynchospora tenuis]KAJ3667971.1 hypothetical protein LUZ61_023003 [Rhynchospora tenuis]KAJ3668063.1 hypothetical protein LUZ61_022987 [Rhynchospora tenuis]